MTELRAEATTLLKEIYSAWDHGSVKLGSMGLRCVLDRHMNELVGDSGNFALTGTPVPGWFCKHRLRWRNTKSDKIYLKFMYIH